MPIYKGLAYNNSFNLHNNPIKKVLLNLHFTDEVIEA